MVTEHAKKPGFGARLGALLVFCASAPLVAVAADSAPTNTVDHAGIIGAWNSQSLARGERLYQTICATCHGTPTQPGSLPNSRPFWLEPFRNGNDPYHMFQTITLGFGQMPAWPWLPPELRYDAIHYIRETFIKPHNPEAYFKITPEYLAELPRAQGTALKNARMLDFEQGPKYLRMDFGRVLFWTYEVEPRNIAYKGIAVQLDPGPGGISRGRAWILYDHDTMRVAAAWTGQEFINWKGIAFDGSHGTHASIAGRRAFVNPPGPGWGHPVTAAFSDPRGRGLDGLPYGPLPREWANFEGVYVHESQVIIAYRIGDSRVLELPALEQSGDTPIFARTLNLGKSSRDLNMRVAPDLVPVGLVGTTAARLDREDGFVRLHIPAAATPLKVKVLIGAASADATAIGTLAMVAEPARDLEPLTKGGPARWTQTIVTKGSLDETNAPFAVDELTPPQGDHNPWKSWLRFGGFDFFGDGTRAAICTWNGDVWMVEGIDSSLQQLTWRRIAAGLFQPLGLKIVNDQIYVTCRDQIARLHDLNGDAEIDFIEAFNHDHQVTEHFHEFAMDLQIDGAGNFYYAKAARHALPPLVPHHGTLLRVSADGSRTDIVASGFRAPNGVCVNADGTFFLTDQEGHWHPKNRINWVRPGRFYGNMWSYDHPASAADHAMEPPLVWITNEMDRSPGEIVRVTSPQWGALNGALLNLSYGTGRVFLLLPERVGDQLQGGVVQLPIPDLPTGVMRGRYHPGNGQLYACGLFAWAGNKTEDGGFYRIRHTGKPMHVPVNLRATRRGLEVTFSDPLRREAATALTNYAVKTWSLRRSEKYGSDHYDTRSLPVERATLSSDNKTVVLEIAGLRPVWCMEIRCDLRAADGAVVRRVIHNTIHEVSE